MKSSTYDSHDDFLYYPEKYFVKPFRIFGGLWFVGNADVGAYLIDTGDGLILIDTAYPTTRDLLIESIWEAGFTPRDIKYILHTHGHYDHFGTTAFIKSLSGAETALSEADAKMFLNRPELALVQDAHYTKMPLFEPDILLKAGDVISLGNASVKAVSVPGHTMGVMAYFFELEENGKKELAGLFGGIGFNTLTREFNEKYNVPEYRENFVQSLRRVRDVPVTITLGNHTGQTDTLTKMEKLLSGDRAENPFINPEEWKRFLAKTEEKYIKFINEGN